MNIIKMRSEAVDPQHFFSFIKIWFRHFSCHRIYLNQICFSIFTFCCHQNIPISNICIRNRSGLEGAWLHVFKALFPFNWAVQWIEAKNVAVFSYDENKLVDIELIAIHWMVRNKWITFSGLLWVKINIPIYIQVFSRKWLFYY